MLQNKEFTTFLRLASVDFWRLIMRIAILTSSGGNFKGGAVVYALYVDGVRSTC
jgi:hypothetical protein